MTWPLIRRVVGIAGLIGLAGCTHLTPPLDASLSQQQRDRVECRALSQEGAGPAGGLFRETMATHLYVECMKSRGWEQQ